MLDDRALCCSFTVYSGAQTLPSLLKKTRKCVLFLI